MDEPLALPDWLVARSPRRLLAFDLAAQGVPGLPAFSGVRVYPGALSRAEAADLLAEIEGRPFLPSQSGKQKQHFGPRFNFMRRRMNADRFSGLPPSAHRLEARLRECVARDAAGEAADLARCRAALADFTTTDVFVLRYVDAECSNLDFHVDDLHAYGEAILDVSLDSHSVLSFLGPEEPGRADGARRREDCTEGGARAPRAGAPDAEDARVCVRVPLPARSIAVVYGAARFAWQHAILAGDVQGVRTSITLRTLAPALRETPAGQQVLARARRSA